MWRHRRTRLALLSVTIAAAAAGAWILRPDTTQADASGAEAAKPDPSPPTKKKRTVSMEDRAALIARAQLWRPPAAPLRRASLEGQNLDELSCKFKVSDLGGTTPKFDCELDSGEEIRIKYGNGPEVPAEAAATRLLRALGFGADDITLVRRLRCYGCPAEPFSTIKAVEVTRAEPLFKRTVDYSTFHDFEWVAMERKFDARTIEAERLEGWSMFELDLVNERRGGAPRAHVDALRLMAVLLAHWDNKSENQRLVCLDEDGSKDGKVICRQPFLLLQDVGATFGPVKMDLEAWKNVAIWDDRAKCTVSMRELPFDGATFGSATITERGRRFLAERLTALSDEQATQLFEHARFGHKRGLFNPTSAVAEWVRTFRAKVAEISEGPPCPTA